MKRVLCLALVLVLLFQILVVPAQASAIGTGILITASAASVISAALIGLGVMPGSDGTVFDGIVSGAADYLSSLGFGDGVGFPVLKYLGTGGTVRYALESAVMVALRSWLFDQDVVSVSGPSFSTSHSYLYFGNQVSFSSSQPFDVVLAVSQNRFLSAYLVSPYQVWVTSDNSGNSYLLDSHGSTLNNTFSGLYFYILSIGYTLDDYSLDDFSMFTYYTNQSQAKYIVGECPITSSLTSQFDVSLGDVAAPNTSLADAYPGWGFDSIQIDPNDGDDPIPYVPIGLDDRYEGVTQEDVQSGESTLETPNDGTQVNISGEVGGSLSPDGGGSGDLPGGEGSVTVDDLTTMFAWLAVRIDEAVQSLFPDLQVIKTYLKTIAQWHETENVKYDSMLSYFSGWDADIDTMLTTVSNIDLNLTTLVDHAAASSDTLAAIAADVQDIRDVIADPLDADINEEEQDNKNAFLNNFSKKSQAKSIGDLSGLSDGFSDWFTLPNVDLSQLWPQIDSGYSGFFSSQVKQGLSLGGGSAATGVGLMSDEFTSYETPGLDSWNAEVAGIFSGGGSN